ncbi:MAG: hypothetical protein RIT45_901 [Pseudomonadota bacterium]
MNAAIIDIGSSSAVVQVVRAQAGRVRILAREKVSLRLGGALGADGALHEEAVARTVATLRRFAELAATHEAPVLAVATEAMRRARNAADVCAAIEADAGVRLQVIDGTQEAALVFAGLRLSRPNNPLLGVDLGGGSTELVFGAGDQLERAVSLPLGAVTLTERVGLGGPASGAAIAAAEAEIAGHLGPAAVDFAGRVERLVGASGSAQRIGRLVLGRDGRLGEDLDGLLLTPADLDWAVRTLAPLSHADRLALPGMDPERADVLLAGAMVLRAVVASLRASALEVALSGIRAGLSAMALGLLPLAPGLLPPRR